MRLDSPTVLQHDKGGLGLNQPISPGTYITGWNFINNLERHPLPPGDYRVRVVAYSGQREWNSRYFDIIVP